MFYASLVLPYYFLRNKTFQSLDKSFLSQSSELGDRSVSANKRLAFSIRDQSGERYIATESRLRNPEESRLFASGQREQSHPPVSFIVILAIPDQIIITYFTNSFRDINADIFRFVLALLHPSCLANLELDVH